MIDIENSILEGRSLSFAYPHQGMTVQSLNIHIRRGRRLALLGANGVGKSTLFLLLNGTLRPQSGKILIDKREAAYNRAALRQWRRRVGLVLQDPDDCVVAPLVFQDISFGPLNLDWCDDRVRRVVDTAMEALGIARLRNRATHQLSFGEKKRVALAGILAMQPEVLLLDEPTAGLDAQGQSQLLDTLARLNEEGMTIVLATHDADLAYAWCDEIAVFCDGKVAIQDQAERVFSDGLSYPGIARPWVADVAEYLAQKKMLRCASTACRDQASLLSSLVHTEQHFTIIKNREQKND